MALERGKLVLNKKGKPQIEMDGKLFNPAQGELSQPIMARLKELNGAEVEFEREGGQPKRIREVGMPFEPPRETASRLERATTAVAGTAPLKRQQPAQRSQPGGGQSQARQPQPLIFTTPTTSSRRHLGTLLILISAITNLSRRIASIRTASADASGWRCKW